MVNKMWSGEESRGRWACCRALGMAEKKKPTKEGEEEKHNNLQVELLWSFGSLRYGCWASFLALKTMDMWEREVNVGRSKTLRDRNYSPHHTYIIAQLREYLKAQRFCRPKAGSMLGLWELSRKRKWMARSQLYSISISAKSRSCNFTKYTNVAI